jgi:hypothetical protein
LVKSFQMNKQYLKSKLFMVYKLINVLNFASASKLMKIIETRINDTSLEGNLFSHSSNPLLNMCLLYELLLKVRYKFFSLNNLCRTLMKTTMDMVIQYIEQIDEENFLTSVMLERDFLGRDVL